MKTVYKPWGKEVWLELNDFYCYKRIYINKGTRTSFQYHVEKLETNYIISGKAEIWLENDEGVVEKSIMKAGDFFTVHPPKKHRVIALTDLVLQEVSTPQVNDVIRIQDDSNRDDGKISNEHLKPAMCILTAGKGSRLGKISDHINKALIPINNKAAISYLIEKTPVDYEIIVAIGYKGQQIVNYCKHMHPDRSFKFINVDNYNPAETGPATSLYACKEHLQRPFFFSASDIIIEEESLGNCDKNWISVYETAISEIYATVEIKDNKVTNIIDKSVQGFKDAWTGMLSIYDYKKFWENFDEKEKEIPNVLKRTIGKINYHPKRYSWYDLGTFDSYGIAKKYFESKNINNYIIPKSNFEYFYKRKERVCKYFPQGLKKVKGLVNRSKSFKDPNIIPKINLKHSNNDILSYKWLQGKDLYDIDSFELYKDCLIYFSSKIWQNKIKVSKNKRMSIGKLFYEKSSKLRFKEFISSRNERKKYFEKIIINNIKIDSFESDLNKIFKKESIIYDCNPVIDYHGDFHFANLIFNKETQNFKIIDWRNKFIDSCEWGDLYYDLGKLYAGCIVQFSKMKYLDSEKYSDLIKEKSYNDFLIKEHRSENIIKFINFYSSWLKNQKYNIEKVKIIAGLVLCRIASLHTYEQGNFLFLHGRKLINESI